MAVLPIVKLGHPALKKVGEPVTEFDNELEIFVRNLIETMEVNEGIGLAAAQVNVRKRVFVINKQLINEEWSAQAYVNPAILSQSGHETLEEGCLSLPGIRAEVDRPFTIKVRYQNVKGEIIEEDMEGLLARVFQHEYDHLQGILFIDRISSLKRKLLEPQLKELEGAYAYR